MDISSMFPQFDVIKYMNLPNDILKNNLYLDILTRSCLLFRNKLYFQYLLNNSNGSITTKDLFIPLSFDSKTRRYIDKNLSKLSQEEQQVIKDILDIIDILETSDQPILNTNTIGFVEATLSNIEDQNLKEKLQKFILPLLYFCNRNIGEYVGPIVVVKFTYADYTCYAGFTELKSYKFKIERDIYKVDFNNYMLSFQPNIIPVTVEDWKLLLYETINLLRSFRIPICNYNEQPIFNVLDIEDISYLDAFLSYTNVSKATRQLIILFYNVVLANLFEQISVENADVKGMLSLIKAIGSGNVRMYYNNLVNIQSTVQKSIDTAMEGYLNIWDQSILDFFNISLEATGTNNEEDITTSDEDNTEDLDNESSDSEDNDEVPDESSEDEQQDPIKKLGIELETNSSSLFDILRKFTYFKELKRIVENSNIPSLVRILVHHWLRYWIFITTVKSTEKFLKRIKLKLK